jgi:AraC family transcriptional regulator of adaptative response/methylated-DNA-[protein]-cysteine methyltransferase
MWQVDAMNDYERIARVIRYLDEHHTEQPGLVELADCVGLTPFHFHRLFSDWAGITPKDFLQCLTLAHARALLDQGEAVLDAALDSGLSGPGRLHDLCVNLESASPGEMKSGGTQWTIVAGFAESPFGICFIAEGPRGICHLSFVESGDEDAAWKQLQDDWPNAKLRRSDTAAAGLARQIFTARGITQWGEATDEPALMCQSELAAAREDSRPTQNHKIIHRHPVKRNSRPLLRAFVTGTAFQVRVWRALLQVAPGQLTTYSRLAEAVGKPAAARAVGTAAGQNPLAYLIPCHRVIRETGVVGDYRWGRIRKRAMLAWETAGKTANNQHAVAAGVSRLKFPSNSVEVRAD